MALGNGNPKSGDKGSNWSFEYKLLTGIQDIATAIGGPGGATAANQVIENGILTNILNAVQSGQDYTQAVVMDGGGVGCPGNCPIYLETRIWNPATQTFGAPQYWNAAGALIVPVGPLTYVNNQAVLQSILVQLATASTSALQTAGNASLTSIAAALTNPLPISGTVAVTGALTQAQLEVELDEKFGDLGQKTSAGSAPVVLASDQSAIPTTLPVVVRTPSYLVTSGNAGITAGKRSVSVFNSGLASGVWLGSALPTGVQLTYEAGGQADTLGAFTYDAIGTTFIITTVV